MFPGIFAHQWNIRLRDMNNFNWVSGLDYQLNSCAVPLNNVCLLSSVACQYEFHLIWPYPRAAKGGYPDRLAPPLQSFREPRRSVLDNPYPGGCKRDLFRLCDLPVGISLHATTKNLGRLLSRRLLPRRRKDFECSFVCAQSCLRPRYTGRSAIDHLEAEYDEG